MDAKYYLEQYKNYALYINRYKSERMYQLHQLREIQSFFNAAPNGLKRGYNERIKEALSFCNSLEIKERRAAEERDAILDVIGSIPGVEGEILHLRYVDGLIWEDVCERVCYSWNGVFKHHIKALRMVQDILDSREASAEPYRE